MAHRRATYRIRLKPAAERSFRRLSRDAQVRVARRIDALATDPFPQDAVKLAGKGSFHRVRAGDYRIVYTVARGELIVLVVAIGHRKEVYRRPRR